MAAAYQPLHERLGTLLQCIVCKEMKELRTLPCNHRICYGCFPRKRSGSHSTCPSCGATLDEQVDVYFTCKAIKYFQKHQEQLVGQLKEIGSEKCAVEGCSSGVTNICRKCKKTYCSVGEHHGECQMEEIVDYQWKTRESFDQWVASKQEVISSLTERKNIAIVEIRQMAQDLADVKAEKIQQLTATTATALNEMEAVLSRLSDDILEETTTLQFAVELTDGVLGLELAVVFSHLKIYDQNRKVELGHYESLIKEFNGCDIAWSPAGHLLIARDGGIDVVEITANGTATVINTLLEGEEVYSIDIFKTNILAAISVGNPYRSTTMVTLDNEYKETHRWSASIQAIDFAVANNNIIFSMIRSPNLKVYSMLGKALPDVLWETSAAGIFGASADSVVLADDKSNRVCRKQISDGKCAVLWTAEVTRPYSVCVDAEELVWVRSNTYDCITILSRRGRKVQEIEDEKLTALTNWGGIMVHGGYLYVTHADGVGRFKITYVDV